MDGFDCVSLEFMWFEWDHTYFNQQEQIDTQLSREPRALPKLRINPEKKDFFALTKEDFSLEGYDPHPAIPSPKPAV
jgi:thymidylate synthase